MSEYVSAIIDGVRERFNSPLLVSFFASWVAWNYKLFFVLFSELDPALKFVMVSALYADKIFDVLGRALLFPVFSAAAFILLHPLVSRQVLKYQMWQHHLTQEVRARGLDKEILLPHEIKSLRERYKLQIDAAESEAERKTEAAAKYKAEANRAEQLLIEERAKHISVVDDLNRKLLDTKEFFTNLRAANDQVAAERDKVIREYNEFKIASRDKYLALEKEFSEVVAARHELAAAVQASEKRRVATDKELIVLKQSHASLERRIQQTGKKSASLINETSIAQERLRAKEAQLASLKDSLLSLINNSDGFEPWSRKLKDIIQTIF
jgi:hypothetical protein